jgi:hypothetical protein
MKSCVLVLVLFACGGKEAPPPVAPAPAPVVVTPDAAPADAPKDEIEIAFEAMTAFRDEMCKCTDKVCADGVHERMTKWSTKMASEAGERASRKVTDAELEQMTEIGRGYGECMVKAGSKP